jgi:hypothetical protein
VQSLHLTLSISHELLVHLFRNRSELTGELLRLTDDPDLEITAAASRATFAEQASTDFTQLVPTEYRADHATLFRDEHHRPVLAVVVEIQLRTDPDKARTWPLYLVAARAQHDCPAVLLVLAPSAAVAAWARTPIKIGHPRFRLEPLVISYPDVPPSLDFSHAHRIPELAVLSALAHPSLQAAQLAADAIGHLSPDINALYLDAIAAALPDEDRRTLEDSMLQGYVYQSDFARKYFGQGKEEGLAEGQQEGLRRAALELARIKLTLAPEEEAAIQALRDPDLLTELVIRLGKARSAKQARAALDRASG